MSVGFHFSNDLYHVDSVPVRDIAHEFGTPAYIYSASHIRRQHEILTSALEKTLPADRQPLLCYACKANTNGALLRLLHSLGTGLEIVSEGELMRGLKAGFKGEQIISTSLGKMTDEIKACLNADIHQLNIEAEPELYHINKIAGEMGKVAPVLFRLNPNISGGGHHKISTGRKRDKFGQSAEKICELYAIADNLDHVRPIGISMHIGSQVFNVDAFKPSFEIMADLVQRLRQNGHTVDRTDIGGGFPIVYNDEKLPDFTGYAEWVRDIILPLDTEIQMEPGRYMTGNSAILLGETIYVKKTQDRDFLILDAGMNDLIRPTLYEAYHNITPIENLDRPHKPYCVAGPICESGDIFAEERIMPEIKDGDLIAIQSAGAYGFAMASNYNSRPLPAEILVDGDNVSLIRRRQTLDEIIQGEIIPDWL